MRRHLAAATALFAIAFVVRWWLRQGLVLGDDPQEFGVLQQALAGAPDLRDQLGVRFGGWLPAWIAARLFGLSETTVLLPTWMLSSACAALAYALLVRWGYRTAEAFAGGLVVATAPFEVVLGTLRTNDMILAGTMAVGFTLLVFLEERPFAQGFALACLLWFGFYVKLWAVYTLPTLGAYFVAGRRTRAAATFVWTSILLHGTTLFYWKTHLGSFTPFIDKHAANYAVPLFDLGRELWRYPHMIFVGSEFHTTLFGVVPWLLVALLVVQVARRRIDRPDRLLIVLWGSLFLLIELFPAGFKLDAYYTVPRIFRYLAPVSFPLTLQAAKLLLDATRAWRPAWRAVVVACLLAANVVGAADATLPGRTFRRGLMAVIDEVERTAPPRVVAEISIGYLLEALYLDPSIVETEVVTPPDLYAATACERWIRDSAPGWPTGTLLLTGLANYVHYGAHQESLRLAWFDRPLDDRWTLADEHDVLWYLPRPETTRLWRLVRGAPGSGTIHEPDDPPPPGDLPPPQRFAAGMAAFDAGQHRLARAHFRVLMDARGPLAEDARFYYAASFFRQERWDRAAREMKHLIGRFPHGRWVPAAQWHIGITELRRGRVRRARARFEYVVRRFPQDPVTVENARAELRRIARRHEGLVIDAWRRLTGRS